ncbi:galactokinase [Corynebacterium sp. HMSC077B05]|uniref:galactokinase n=1 Tax=Corynebacterium sp. HMSC077B05 TaxID=1739252 RepID=UPI0008A62C95|nr:galactokinase [Corynebacterium sp. HMSC077B05]OFL76649.1 galactokinase [Corynebacterium sp. HMSC077B05]
MTSYKWIESRTPDALAADATALFNAEFGTAPTGVWAAPGRVNVIGEHVDYAGGVCIPFALPLQIAAAVTPREDTKVVAASQKTDGTVARAEVDLKDIRPGGDIGWLGYVAGTVWAAHESGALENLTGLNIALVSDVPLGSGLSSSAALECSVAVAAYELDHGQGPDDAARHQLADAAMRAENDIVGASTGGLDQTASLFGAEGKALVIDFDSHTHRLVNFDIADQDLVLLIADTNAPHELNDGQYASRRGVIDDVQNALGSLRHLSEEQIAAWAHENGKDATLYAKRTGHVLHETARTLQAADALEAGDFDTFRRFMADSHASLRDGLEVTTPELDSAAEAAGTLGARMTGGGFGGAVIALIAKARVGDTVAAIASAAEEKGFAEPTFYIATPGDGARRLV